MTIGVGILTRQVRSLIPAEQNKRRYVIMRLISAAGEGLFLTGTAVFAIRVVHLDARQISLCFSVAGLAGILASGISGRLADRFGAKQTMLLAYALSGLVYLGYCFARSFLAFLLLATLASAFRFCAAAPIASYVSTIATEQERIGLRAQARSLINAGFGIGASLAALVLVVGTTPAYYLLPIGNAAAFFAIAALVTSLPEGGRAAPQAADHLAQPFPARRNLPFLAATALNAILRMHDSLLLLIVPLWIVSRTSAPKAFIGVFLVCNTIVGVLLQVRASRGAETLAGGVRKVRVAAAVMVPGCLAVALSGHTSAALAVLCLLAGYVSFTGTELLQCAGEWGILYTLAPPEALGDYAGVFGMSGAVQEVLGPGIGGWLVLTYGTAGWMAIALMFAVAAGLQGVAVSRAALLLARRKAEVTPPVSMSPVGVGRPGS
jgi:Major Facilitator Superfamily